MVSRKKRASMDSLKKEELRSEILLGRKSRFSQDIPYLQQRLARIEDKDGADSRGEDVSIAKKGNRLRTYAIIVSLLALLAYIVYQ